MAEAKKSSKKPARKRPVKPKAKLQTDAPIDDEPIFVSPEPLITTPSPHGRVTLLSAVAALAAVAILLWAGFNAVYAGKVLPGVSVAGTYVGGLSRAEAMAAATQSLADYRRQTLPINYGTTTVRINLSTLNLNYNLTQSADLAMSFGRNGSPLHQVYEQMRALAGRPTNIVAYSFDDAKLAQYFSHIEADVVTPVRDAGLSLNGDAIAITPSLPGTRLDIGRLTQALNDRLANLSSQAVDAPVYYLSPAIERDDLEPAEAQAQTLLNGPVTIHRGDQTDTLTPTQLAAWLKVIRPTTSYFNVTNQVTDLLSLPAPVTVSLDRDKIAAYVAGLAQKIDQPGQDAALTIQDGRATVFRPSRAGYQLNQPKAITDILAAAAKSGSRRQLALDVTVKQPDVTEDRLNDLGINELISEGYSTFPGSSSARLTNVRIGAARYNGVLLKPDEVFSFGALLGDVGPEQGYLPSLVIIGNKEEKQYGGGLCQVSSTAYRAALNAGLPIVERVNHAFAVDFYTQPYGVPGVDATIYYPQVDMKFKNDTGHYILIQTIMSGTTLKFDFYGTKTKTGKIRGPFFISGSLDATQPSHTVFYRDVLDLAGNVTKTDTVNTWYKSSKDFTIVENNQFH